MDYKIVLESYEGPLDLLLNLIERSKIDIYDIPISIITKQYLEYMYKMEKLNLDLASDFILMAASLIQIKSKMLLPSIMEEDDEDEDPRRDLVERLLAYKKIKKGAEELKKREDLGLKTFYKAGEDLSDLACEVFDLKAIDISKLVKTINKLLEKQNIRDATIDLEVIQREEYSVKECSEKLIKLLGCENKIMFSQLLEDNFSKGKIVAYFLSILELIKLKKIDVLTNEDYTDLTIIKILGEDA